MQHFEPTQCDGGSCSDMIHKPSERAPIRGVCRVRFQRSEQSSRHLCEMRRFGRLQVGRHRQWPPAVFRTSVQLMEQRRVKRMPVMHDRRVVGIIAALTYYMRSPASIFHPGMRPMPWCATRFWPSLSARPGRPNI
jgi:hypothetical protein